MLYRRFKKLDRKRVGFISSQDFYLIPELSMNPLCDRVIALFDPQRSEQVTFDSFVQTVNLFHQQTPVDERVKAVFQVYDVDGDGFITASDLLALVTATTQHTTVLTRDAAGWLWWTHCMCVIGDVVCCQLRMLVGDNIDDTVLSAIVAQTLHECGQSSDGRLSVDDCQRLIGPDVAKLALPKTDDFT